MRDVLNRNRSLLSWEPNVKRIWPAALQLKQREADLNKGLISRLSLIHLKNHFTLERKVTQMFPRITVIICTVMIFAAHYNIMFLSSSLIKSIVYLGFKTLSDSVKRNQV